LNLVVCIGTDCKSAPAGGNKDRETIKCENQNLMTENILLRDSEINPTNEILESALGKDIFQVYEELIKIITDVELKPEWNYYKDGKAWLCKVSYKKKTVFWLSIWENHIKTGFYFTEKTRLGISGLKINDKIIQNFEEAKTVGKLFPLVLNIDKERQLEDLKEIIKYKKSVN